jgi:AraC family transcriptional activator FtrA
MASAHSSSASPWRSSVLTRPEFDFPWYEPLHRGSRSRPDARHGRDSNAGRWRPGIVGASAHHHHSRLARPQRGEVPPALIDALRQAHARGARLLCRSAPAYLCWRPLACSTATAPLRIGATLRNWRRRFPAIAVDADVLYVDSGQLITSAGSAAGIDACLHLVARDFGTQVANSVARRLVMSPQRTGGQAQFIPTPSARHRATICRG